MLNGDIKFHHQSPKVFYKVSILFWVGNFETLKPIIAVWLHVNAKTAVHTTVSSIASFV